MNPTSIKKRRIILLVSFIVFILLVPIIILYTSGYRIDKNLHFRKTGGLYISAPLSGTRIFIDEKERGETSLLQRGVFLQNLTPGTYSILVAKDKFWPWAKNLKVNEEKCNQELTPEIYATEEVHSLVKRGVPFREAYRKISKKYAEKK